MATPWNDRTATRADAWTTPTRNWADRVVLAFGLVFLAVGALGFIVTNNVPFAAHHGGHLLGIFEVNPLDNLVHLAIGALLMIAFLSGHRGAIVMAGIVGGIYLVVGVAGPFLSGRANVLALNTPDHLLHLASALALLVTAFAGRRLEAGQPLATDTRDHRGRMAA